MSIRDQFVFLSHTDATERTEIHFEATLSVTVILFLNLLEIR